MNAALSRFARAAAFAAAGCSETGVGSTGSGRGAGHRLTANSRKGGSSSSRGSSTLTAGNSSNGGDALKATGRPISYRINPVYGGGACVPPKCEVDELKICNMWLIELDINASWGSFTGLIDKRS